MIHYVYSQFIKALKIGLYYLKNPLLSSKRYVARFYCQKLPHAIQKRGLNKAKSNTMKMY